MDNNESQNFSGSQQISTSIIEKISNEPNYRDLITTDPARLVDIMGLDRTKLDQYIFCVNDATTLYIVMPFVVFGELSNEDLRGLMAGVDESPELSTAGSMATAFTISCVPGTYGTGSTFSTLMSMSTIKPPPGAPKINYDTNAACRSQAPGTLASAE